MKRFEVMISFDGADEYTEGLADTLVEAKEVIEYAREVYYKHEEARLRRKGAYFVIYDREAQEGFDIVHKEDY